MGGFIRSRTKTKISRNFGAIKWRTSLFIVALRYRMPNSFSNRLCWASNAKNVRWLLGEWSRNDKTIIVLNDRFTKKIKPFYTS
jgi:hypothetical protein